VAAPDQFLNPSEAAKRLGVSVKALRLYEQRGLVTPMRTATGWRVYGPDAMTRVAEIVGLRELGLSLGQVAQVLNGDATGLGVRAGRASGRARRPPPSARRGGGKGSPREG
jgi:DNA-binding transcriptional MerR regulator